MPCSRLQSCWRWLARRSRGARVLRSSGVPISRATAVQDSHPRDGIISMILASALRASIRRGSLQARSANLRKASTRELLANAPPTISGFTPCGRPGFTSGFISAFTWGLSGRRGDLVLQFGAGLSNLRRHQRAVLDLKENTLGLLAIARRSFLHLFGNSERIPRHGLALLGALDQLCAHVLDLFRRRFIFADNGFGRQLADLGRSLAVFDIVGYRDCRRTQLRWRKVDGMHVAKRWTVADLRLDLFFQINNIEDLFCY